MTDMSAVGDSQQSDQNAASEEAAASAAANEQTTTGSTTAVDSVGAPQASEVAGYSSNTQWLSNPSGTVQWSSPTNSSGGTPTNPVANLRTELGQLLNIRNMLSQLQSLQGPGAPNAGVAGAGGEPVSANLGAGGGGATVGPGTQVSGVGTPTAAQGQALLKQLQGGGGGKKGTAPAPPAFNPNLGAGGPGVQVGANTQVGGVQVPTTAQGKALYSVPGKQTIQQLQQQETALMQQIRSNLAQVGVTLPANVTSPDQILNMKLPPQAIQQLGTLGYNTSNMGTVNQLVQAPVPNGGVAPQAKAASAQAAYKALIQAYGSSPQMAASLYSELQNAGLLNPNYSGAEQVANGFQTLVDQAQTQNISPMTLLTNMGNQNAQITGNMPATGYLSSVQTIADEYGVNLTPAEQNAIANKLASGNYEGTTSQDDAARQAIAAMINPATFDPQTVSPASWAAQAVQAAQDEFGQYGIAPSNSQLGNIVQEIFAGGASTDYQVADQAQAAAEDQAKQQAMLQFPGLASQLSAGTTLSQLVSPFIGIYNDLTGANLSTGAQSSMALTGATGKLLQTALTGGQDGQAMTSAEFEQAIMNDPSSGYSTSQTALQRAASLGTAIRNLFGAGGPENANPGYWSYSTSTSNQG